MHNVARSVFCPSKCDLHDADEANITFASLSKNMSVKMLWVFPEKPGSMPAVNLDFLPWFQVSILLIVWAFGKFCDAAACVQFYPWQTGIGVYTCCNDKHSSSKANAN